MSMDLMKFFQQMIDQGASDLFLKTYSRPAMRVDGKIRFLSDTAVSPDDMWKVFDKLLDDACKENFQEFGGADFALALPNIGRFRANVFRFMSQHGMVFRHVQEHIPTFKDLGLPKRGMEHLASLSRGLVLATGITGSGKSTCLASIINHINKHQPKHVVTVEDPIEYIFKEDKSIFSQREVGIDAESFPHALRHALRQSPDIILIGEMRDKETVEAAINAAETGHLVFSTLHTINAIQTVERIVMFFPPHQHEMLRQQLSLVLEGVISLRLLRKASGAGRVPAVELLLGAPSIKEMIAEGRTLELPKALRDSFDYYGTMTFNQSLKLLVDNNLVTREDALSSSDSPDDLKMELQGIRKGSAYQY